MIKILWVTDGREWNDDTRTGKITSILSDRYIHYTFPLAGKYHSAIPKVFNDLGCDLLVCNSPKLFESIIGHIDLKKVIMYLGGKRAFQGWTRYTSKANRAAYLKKFLEYKKGIDERQQT